FQFCIRSKDPDKDKDILIQLYNCGFFQPTPKNHTKQFWNAYQDALDSNICGIDGKRRILSIIADTFSYETIK
ncbi:16112_t:CDS:1, partial [Rhizophagus irregularis]